jgi:hypothetical protein
MRPAAFTAEFDGLALGVVGEDDGVTEDAGALADTRTLCDGVAAAPPGSEQADNPVVTMIAAPRTPVRVFTVHPIQPTVGRRVPARIHAGPSGADHDGDAPERNSSS